MDEIVFTKIGYSSYSVSNTTELETIINNVLNILNLNQQIDHEQITNEVFIDRLVSRLISGFVITKKQDIIPDSGYVLLNIAIYNRNIKVTVGTLNKDNNNYLLNGVLYN